MSAVDMNRFCEPFNAMTARRYLSEKGAWCCSRQGSGNPFFSTDTAVALRAIEMQGGCHPDGEKNIDSIVHR